jgi:hypothetical protein
MGQGEVNARVAKALPVGQSLGGSEKTAVDFAEYVTSSWSGFFRAFLASIPPP